jgi:hypothetical protein
VQSGWSGGTMMARNALSTAVRARGCGTRPRPLAPAGDRPRWGRSGRSSPLAAAVHGDRPPCAPLRPRARAPDPHPSSTMPRGATVLTTRTPRASRPGSAGMPTIASGAAPGRWHARSSAVAGRAPNDGTCRRTCPLAGCCVRARASRAGRLPDHRHRRGWRHLARARTPAWAPRGQRARAPLPRTTPPNTTLYSFHVARG